MRERSGLKRKFLPPCQKGRKKEDEEAHGTRVLRNKKREQKYAKVLSDMENNKNERMGGIASARM
jgi:hypothetical protein